MDYAATSALWITGAVAAITWASVFFYLLKVDRDLQKAEKRRSRQQAGAADAPRP